MSQDYRTIQYSFIGGLLSPMQEGAVGSTLYQQGLSIAENVLYGPGYGLMKRHGTQYQAGAYADSAIYPYLYNGTIYGVEFGERKARLIHLSSFDDGGVATIGEDVDTPYSAKDSKGLSVVANLNRLYIVHHGYKPRTMDISNGSLQAPVEIAFTPAIQAADSPSEGDSKTTAVEFNNEGDYPSRQLFYGGRWFLMSTDNNPQMIWYSRSYDSDSGSYRFTDFTTSYWTYRLKGEGLYEWEEMELADLGGAYLNSDMHGSSIRWAIAHQNILIATGRAIYSDKGVTTITSSADYPFSLSPSLSYGSAGGEAYAIGSYVFFAGIDNRSVRCIAYNQTYNSYAGSDISTAVAQYLSSGIRMMCVTDGQMPMLWVLANDGTLLSCYFESGQIIAWSRICFDGDDHPEWISSIQGGDDGYCALSLIMRRGSMRTIETLEVVAASVVWQYPCIDCWKRYETAGDSIEPSFADGGRKSLLLIVHDDKERGTMMEYQQLEDVYAIESEDDAKYYEGLGYTMVAGTLRTELPANGTSQGAKRAVTSVTLRLYNSIGGSIALRPEISDSLVPMPKASDSIAPSMELFYRIYGKALYGEPLSLFTGDKSTQFSTKVLDDNRLVIAADSPFPFCICAIIIKHSATEA